MEWGAIDTNHTNATWVTGTIFPSSSFSLSPSASPRSNITDFSSSSSNTSSNAPQDSGNYSNDYDYDYFDWHTASVLPSMAYLALYDSIGLLGIFGNVMILCVLRHRSLSSLSYSVYLRFLAVSDLSVIVFRLLEINLDRFQHIYQRMLTWHLRFCQTFTLLDNWTLFASLWLVVVVTCDRFIAVALPLQWKVMSTKKRAFYTCVLFCLVTFLVNLSVYVTIDVMPDELQDKLYCTNRKETRVLSDVINFAFGSLLPCAIIFAFNMMTLFKIKVSARKRNELTKQMQTEQRGRNGAKFARAGEMFGGSSNLSDNTGNKRGAIVFPTSDGEAERENPLSGAVHTVGTDVAATATITTTITNTAPQEKEASSAESENSAHTNEGFESDGDLGAGELVCTAGATIENDHKAQATKEDRTSSDKKLDKKNNKNKNRASLSSTSRQTNTTRQSRKGARLDVVTISLTYISISAFLSLAPYGILHTMFMVFLDQYDSILAVNPLAPVPQYLQNLIRVWDLIELVFLLNFCQNFYILLLTNTLVRQATQNTLRCAKQ